MVFNSIILKRLSLTSDSEPALPGLNIFVESQIIAETPLSPIFLSFASSIFPPINGLGSIFQSPVCNMVPSGVLMQRPLGSRIECVKVTKSISKLPSLILLFSATIFKCETMSIFFSLNFSTSNVAVKGVA